MPRRTVIVGSAVGLHARPAAKVAEKANEYDADVYLSVGDGEPVDAASALMIMTLDASQGTEVTVESDDEEAMNAVAAAIETDLDAPRP